MGRRQPAGQGLWHQLHEHLVHVARRAEAVRHRHCPANKLVYYSQADATTAGNKNWSAIKGQGGTTGPLTRSMVDNAYHSSSLIPMIADANVGDIKEAILKNEVPGYLPAGSRLVESFSDGPCLTQATSTSLPTWGLNAIDRHRVRNSVNPANPNYYADEQPPMGMVPRTLSSRACKTIATSVRCMEPARVAPATC